MTPDTRPKPFAFVIMPFDKAFDDVYQLGIKPACERAGAYAERVDEQFFENSILDRIYNQIAKADIVVADLTGRSANVFYETGYAHALGKRVILLTQRMEDIPFDLQHYPHIVYHGRVVDLIPELEARVRWCIEHPDDASADPSSIFRFRVNGVPLEGGPVVEHAERRAAGSGCGYTLSIEINNVPERQIRVDELQVGLLTGPAMTASYLPDHQKCNVVSLPDGRRLHLPGLTFSILPGAWDKVSLYVRTDGDEVDVEQELALRAFTRTGYADHPFSLRFTRS